MSHDLRLGFIGLGTMGGPMARNLARAGFTLGLYTRTASKAEALAAELGPPAWVADSPAALGSAADVVISCLPDSPEVEEVHLGARGTALSPRPGLVIVDSSTIAAERARSLAERLAARGVGWLDAPVSGGQKGAMEGTLSFFVGGEEPALAQARPALEAMGKRITRLGPAGAGQLGKATNQVIVALNLLAVSEGLAFAARAGLPLPELHQALTGGAANSWALEVLGKKMMARDFKPAFAVKHQQKDLGIVLDTARAARLPLPGVALVHQLLCALEAQGQAEDGTQALLELYERLSGAQGRR